MQALRHTCGMRLCVALYIASPPLVRGPTTTGNQSPASPLGLAKHRANDSTNTGFRQRLQARLHARLWAASIRVLAVAHLLHIRRGSALCVRTDLDPGGQFVRRTALHMMGAPPRCATGVLLLCR